MYVTFIRSTTKLFELFTRSDERLGTRSLARLPLQSLLRSSPQRMVARFRDTVQHPGCRTMTSRTGSSSDRGRGSGRGRGVASGAMEGGRGSGAVASGGSSNPSLLTLVTGDLLHAPDQYIVHQTNCVTTSSKGMHTCTASDGALLHGGRTCAFASPLCVSLCFSFHTRLALVSLWSRSGLALVSLWSRSGLSLSLSRSGLSLRVLQAWHKCSSKSTDTPIRTAPAPLVAPKCRVYQAPSAYTATGRTSGRTSS